MDEDGEESAGGEDDELRRWVKWRAERALLVKNIFGVNEGGGVPCAFLLVAVGVTFAKVVRFAPLPLASPLQAGWVALQLLLRRSRGLAHTCS